MQSATATAATAEHTRPASSTGVLTRRVIDLLPSCILSQCCQGQQQGDKGDDFALHGCSSSRDTGSAGDTAWTCEMDGLALLRENAAMLWCTEGLMAWLGWF
jgi:hypothetical protein